MFKSIYNNPEEALQTLNQRYAFVNVSGKSLIFHESFDHNGQQIVEPTTITDFKPLYANRFVQVGIKESRKKGEEDQPIYKPLGDWWLTHAERRTYYQVCFDPTKQCPPHFYNLWLGLAVDPALGDCSLYWKHVREVICNDGGDLYAYVRKWMAHAVQKTPTLPETAIVLRGNQGAGKNTFAKWFGKLFHSAHYGELASLNSLVGRFTGHLANKIIIYANEATWGGDKQSEGVLKALITDPEKFVEYKGKDGFFIKNFARVIIASNNDWAVPMGMDDRRFVSCNVSKRRVGDYDYFAAITDQMENGGLQALMHDLLHEDISNWNPRQRPRSAIRDSMDQKLMSMSPIEQFVFQWVTDNEVETYPADKERVGFYLVRHNDLFAQYLEWCERLKIHHILNTKTFSLRVWGKLIPYEGKFRYEGRKKGYIVPNARVIKDHYEREVIKQELPSDDDAIEHRDNVSCGPSRIHVHTDYELSRDQVIDL